jgi:hypothetical protein
MLDLLRRCLDVQERYGQELRGSRLRRDCSLAIKSVVDGEGESLAPSIQIMYNKNDNRIVSHF